MSRHDYSPAGRTVAVLYGLAIVAALFSGFGQMPLYQRYYITSIPFMAWTGNFSLLSLIHYLAAMLLMALLAWRISLSRRIEGCQWSWGPRSWWGWALLAILVISGAAKAMRNSGIFISPQILTILDLTHMFTAMVFMLSGLASLIRGRGAPAPAASKAE